MSLDIFKKLMFKGLPKKVEDNMLVAKIGNIIIQRDFREYTANTPKVCVKIEDIVVDKMLDSSIEVNVMTRALANKVGLTIRTNMSLALKTILGKMKKFDNACKDIDVSIGGLTNV